MCLRILPLLSDIAALNPDWVLLTLIYWSLSLPERAGIFHAWTFGLLTDALTGRLLGQYALAYALVIFLCLNLHKRLRHFPMLQQGLFIFFCLLLSQLLLFFIKNIINKLYCCISFFLVQNPSIFTENIFKKTFANTKKKVKFTSTKKLSKIL